VDIQGSSADVNESSSSFFNHLHDEVHPLKHYRQSTGDGHGNDNGGEDLSWQQPSAINPRAVRPGPDFEETPGRELSIAHPVLLPSRRIFFSPPNAQLPAPDTPLDWAADGFRLHLPVGNEYSAAFETGANQPSQCPLEQNSGALPIADANSTFPWNTPENAQATSISGGTFIGGNVNHIQRHGETGESCTINSWVEK
jgi:hypothetical protein